MDGANPVTNPLGALQAMTAPMTQMMTEGYERNKAQIDTLKAAAQRSSQDDAAERWASMAQAAAKVPPMVGGFGALLASIGGAYGQTLNRQEQEHFTRQAEIAKLMQSGGMGGLGQGSMTAMTQAALNPIQNIGGVGINRLTGQMVVPKALEGEYSKLFSKFYETAVEQKMPNPEQWAQQQAQSLIEQQILANPSIAGSIYGQRPGQTPLPSQISDAEQLQPTVPAPEAPAVELPAKDIGPWVSKLKKDEAEAVRAGDYGRALEVKKARQALEAEQQRAKTGESMPTAPTAQGLPSASAPPPLQYKDTRAAAFKEEWGAKEAATLEKALTEASTTIGKSASLVSTLNTLEGLLNVDNVPQGKFAPMLTEFRSGLTSFNIDVDKATGPAQVATALANEMALRLRTGSGENLMPGQMSNFDAQLLMSMAPTLSQTREGRNMLLNFMREAANSQRRIAAEAQKFAAANNGMLTPEWRAIAAELERKEMAKRELARRRIMRQFEGQKK